MHTIIIPETFDQSDTAFIFAYDRDTTANERVVVTNTRSGYLLRDVPIAEVIRLKEINESGAVTVNELLSQRAGVSTSVNVDGGAIFNMLGLDSRYILVLENGQPVTGRFNNRVDLNQVSINNIKKIEITKGPGSAVYGTDAMGGVINIITQNLLKFQSLALPIVQVVLGTLKRYQVSQLTQSSKVDFQYLSKTLDFLMI